jgi:hypothetical protein
VMRHPAWISNFNMNLDQIHDLFAISKDEHIIVQSTLETSVLKSSKIFYYGSGGDMLCINSYKDLKCEDDALPVKCGGEYLLRPGPGGHAQWTFPGNRWGGLRITNSGLTSEKAWRVARYFHHTAPGDSALFQTSLSHRTRMIIFKWVPLLTSEMMRKVSE